MSGLRHILRQKTGVFRGAPHDFRTLRACFATDAVLDPGAFPP